MGRGSDAISYSQRGNKRGLIFRAGAALPGATFGRGGRAERRQKAAAFDGYRREGGEKKVLIPPRSLRGRANAGERTGCDNDTPTNGQLTTSSS